MTTTTLKLADNVFYCLSDDRLVFLDLRNDQYLCLSRHNTQIATDLLTDTTEVNAVSPKGSTSDNAQESRRIVQALTDRGLLIEGSTNGSEPAAVRLKAPENALREEVSPSKRTRLRHWAAFYSATLRASYKLRWYSMRQTVRSVEERKMRHENFRKTDQDALHHLVAVFHRLRPYYVRKYLCLYDSLALLEFLAHFRLYPQWVFGVTAEPFAAHCWIQDNNCLLNDSVDYVSVFTPIMVV